MLPGIKEIVLNPGTRQQTKYAVGHVVGSKGERISDVRVSTVGGVTHLDVYVGEYKYASYVGTPYVVYYNIPGMEEIEEEEEEQIPAYRNASRRLVDNGPNPYQGGGINNDSPVITPASGNGSIIRTIAEAFSHVGKQGLDTISKDGGACS